MMSRSMIIHVDLAQLRPGFFRGKFSLTTIGNSLSEPVDPRENTEYQLEGTAPRWKMLGMTKVHPS
jgi:hypothetical protein